MKLNLTLLTIACSLALANWSHADTIVYFSDSFDTGGDGGSYDVNDAIGSPRQGGTLVGPGGIAYAEASATAANGPDDWQSQVNNPGAPDLLLINARGDFTNPVSVSPDLDFGSTPVTISFNIAVGDMPDSAGYSYINFGSANQNDDVNGNTGGLGLAMYADGSWALYAGSTEEASGTGTALSPSSHVPIAITLEAGEVYLTINGVQQDLNGAAPGDGYADTITDNYITLGHSNNSDTNATEFIGDLAVTSPISAPEPSSVALLIGGLAFAALILRRRTNP